MNITTTEGDKGMPTKKIDLSKPRPIKRIKIEATKIGESEFIRVHHPKLEVEELTKASAMKRTLH